MTDTPKHPEDDTLARLTAGLPRSIEPPADLWPGTRAQIAPARRAAWPGWQVAAVLALVALSSFITWSLARRQVPEAPMVVVETDVGVIEQYAAAAGELARELGSTDGTAYLTPETRAILERNLAVIDSVIAECRAALEADSSNAALRNLLGSAERQRLDFLRQAARLPRS